MGGPFQSALITGHQEAKCDRAGYPATHLNLLNRPSQYIQEDAEQRTSVLAVTTLSPYRCDGKKKANARSNLQACKNCLSRRRLCPRKGCSNDTHWSTADCLGCARQKGKKEELIKCHGLSGQECLSGGYNTVFLWRGIDEARWPTKEKLLREYPYCRK